jgi:hypothetical protein
MSDTGNSTKWWRRNVWKLPVWAWIVIIIFVASVIGSSGSSDSTGDSSAESADTTVMQSTDTTAPAATTTEAPAEPELTVAQENAIKSALSYISFSAFSREGLIQQLSSEYGEKFALDLATFAVDYIEKDPGVDWNEQAAKSAKSYLDTQSFSCQGLIDQLSSQYGEKFTKAQATYGATEVGLC